MAASLAPVSRRTFWITVAAFALANITAWVAYHQYRSNIRKDLLRVETFSPGDAAVVGRQPVFTWIFNLDAAPDASAESSGSPGVIKPNVKGRWEWTSPRTLTFSPTEMLPRATRFTVALANDLRTPEGFTLAAPFKATVSTEALQVVSVRQTGIEVDGQFVIEIQFNDKVRPAEAMRHLAVASGRESVTIRPAAEDGDGHYVRVIANPPPSETSERSIEVTVREGLRGGNGELGLATDSVHTLKLESALVATEAEAETPARGQPQITVRFNNRPDLEILRSALSIDPPVPFDLGTSYSGAVLTGAFEPGRRYTVTIAKPRDNADALRHPRAATLTAFIPDRAAGVWMEATAGYLGTKGNRTLLAHAVNWRGVTANVHRVYDTNLVPWRNSGGDSAASVGALLGSGKKFKLETAKNVTQDLRIALDDLLPANDPRDGVYAISLEAETDGAHDDYRGSRNARALVTLSDIGLSARRTRNGLLAWAVSLSTGKPMEGVRVRVFSNKNQPLGEATTGADGLAELKEIRLPKEERATVLLADLPAGGERGRNLTWLDLSENKLSFAEFNVGGDEYHRAGYEAYVFTERGVYRPGESVHLQAIIRDPNGAAPGASFPVRWLLRRPDLRDWKSIPGMLDADGAVRATVALPADLPTGHWTVKLLLPGAKESDVSTLGDARFQIEEFLPDRIAVSLNIGENDGSRRENAQTDLPGLVTPDDANKRRQMNADDLRVSVDGDYLFGQPAAGCAATLVARWEPAPFSSPQWKGWTFGDSANVAAATGGLAPKTQRRELPPATLNDDGTATFDLFAAMKTDKDDATIDPIVDDPDEKDDEAPRPGTAKNAALRLPWGDDAGPWTLTATASVLETGNRAVSTSRTFAVDAAPHYVGVRAKNSGTAIVGAPFALEVALVTPPGTAENDSATLEAVLLRESWNSVMTFKRGRYRYESTRSLERVATGCPTTVAVENGKGALEISAPSGGNYVLFLNDPKSRTQTTLSFTAGANDGWDDTVSREDPERIELSVVSADGANAARFAPGQANVIVRSPFAGRLLLTVETDDVLFTRVIEMERSHASVPITLDARCWPNAYVTATVVRPVDPNAPWRGHRARGVAPIALQSTERAANVAITTPTEMRPDGALPVELRVTAPDGTPVAGAAVTVMAVDEGILQLTQFKSPDPLAHFGAKRAWGVSCADIYSDLMAEVAKADGASAVGGGSDSEGDDGRYRSPISAKRVRSVALVSAVLRTDADGRATTSLAVPSFIGRLRVMAVAYGGARLGSAANAVTVSSPLIVQSSWPRFAAPGDRFSVPVKVFNRTSRNASDVTASIELLDDGAEWNPIELPDPSARRYEFKIADRIKDGLSMTADLPIVIGRQAGVGRAKLTVRMNGETFTETIEFPVRPASPTISQGGALAVTPATPATMAIPGGMLDGTRALTLRVTPWPMLELPAGIDYLERYPYGCAEQTVSTSFPLVYLSAIGERVAPGVFAKERVREKVQAGIARLQMMQTIGGGIAMWPGRGEPWPWASVYAAHLLVEAGRAGHSVPVDFKDRVLGYLRAMVHRGETAETDMEVRAYACYVLALAESPDRAAMNRLAETINDSTAGSARLFLSVAWLASGRKDLATGLIPAAMPAPRAVRQLGGNVGSATRDQALWVLTLLDVEPTHPTLPGAVQALADSGRRGQWQSTQETAFAVMAIGKYLAGQSQKTPYESAEIWVDGERVDSGAGALAWTMPATRVKSPRNVEVRIAGKPDATAHATWLQTGVPIEALPAADQGLNVRRRYLDSKGKPIDRATIGAGELVQVELTLDSPMELKNVVVEDLLPAGLEIENPRLETTAADAVDGAANNAWANARIDIRDDRYILLLETANAGKATFRYTARAVTAGIFATPPVRAECMYDPARNSIAHDGATLTVRPRETK